MFDNLDELRTFLRVIDHGSLSAAARSMHLSVNAVWARIARLEDRVGQKLMERTSRRLRVTELGLRVAERMRRIVAEIEGAESDVSATTHRLSGTVRIALPGNLSRQLMPCLLGLLSEHPALSIEVLGRVAPEAMGPLDVDFTVWGGPIPDRAFTIKRIGTLKWALAAAPSYVFRRGVPRLPADLLHHECILARKPMAENSWPLVDSKGHTLVAPIAGRLTCDVEESQIAALYAGQGIGIRPHGEVLAAARSGALVHVLPSYWLRPMDIFAVAPLGRLRVPRVRVVVDKVETELRSLLAPDSM
jgi:DNA-binding transcriptional LysR family regulator